MVRAVHIVTGATGGLGRAIVAGLDKAGASHIVLACRNEGKTRKQIDSWQGKARLEYIHLDLADDGSVREFAAEIAAREYRVAALINNAGVLPSRAEGYASAWQTNYVATRLLTELLLPAMGQGSHIVLTTSLTRHIALWPVLNRFTNYGRSKRALHNWGLALAEELRPKGIIVALADPGAADTGMIAMHCRPIDYLADRIARPLMSTPEQGAQPALMAAQAEKTATLFARRWGKTVAK